MDGRGEGFRCLDLSPNGVDHVEEARRDAIRKAKKLIFVLDLESESLDLCLEAIVAGGGLVELGGEVVVLFSVTSRKVGTGSASGRALARRDSGMQVLTLSSPVRLEACCIPLRESAGSVRIIPGNRSEGRSAWNVFERI